MNAPKLSTAEFTAIVTSAERAGREAAIKCRPTPMVVYTPTSNDFFKADGAKIDLSQPVYFVDDGACGFAWVQFPANTAFGRFMKKSGKARKAYPSGLWVWVSEFGQSIERKEAFAGAYAKVLRERGIECHAGSRLD